MPDLDPCELCGAQAEGGRPADYAGIQQNCPRCGAFRLSETGMDVIRRVPPEEKAKLSAWVRHQSMLGEMPELTRDRIRLLAKAPIPGISERADHLLSFAIKNQNRLGEKFDPTGPEVIAVTYSRDDGEVTFLRDFLVSRELIRHHGGRLYQVTPTGYIRYEDLQARQTASAQGFVAMWFDDSMDNAYVNGFELAIREAGYDPIRVDSVEHVGKIDDEIIAQIKRSRFVVADFTGQRGGVYFEAGFALGLDLPVIWTCRQDDIGALHFDVRQFNCIDWTDPDDLAARLQRRIEAVIGVGPRKPLPQ